MLHCIINIDLVEYIHIYIYIYIYTDLTFVFVNMCCSADLTFPTTGLGSLNPWTDTSPIMALRRSWHCLPVHCTRPIAKIGMPAPQGQ